MQPMNPVLFTAIIGGYDKGEPVPDECRTGWTCLCFSDDPNNVAHGWTYVPVDMNAFPGLPPVAVAKHIKIFPESHLFNHVTQNVTHHLWIDGNRRVLKDLNLFLDKYKDSERLTMTHPNTKYADLYSEITSIRKHPRPYLQNADKRIDYQEKFYRDEGIPGDAGCLCENGVLLRQPTWENRMLGHLWWQELFRFRTWRDQIALRVVLYRLGWKIDLAPRKDVSRAEPNGKAFFQHTVHESLGRK